MTFDSDDEIFKITDKNSLWHGASYYQLYQQAHTPWEWHKSIFDYCKKLGLVAFSTPFDETAVDFLESLDVPCYKIASFETGDLSLLRKVAATGKPVIIATGTATLAELDEAVTTLRAFGCKDLILLKCTSAYPAPVQEANLLTIPCLQSIFDCHVGLSDHTLGIGVGIASVALGAVLIEKHFALSRSDGGVDTAFSMEPHEMHNLVIDAERANFALGKVTFGPTAHEQASLVFKRSLYINQDVNAGELLTKEKIKIARPGHGLPPKYLNMILNKPVRCMLKRGTPLKWEYFF
jgi:N-acetylneuraminate synthase